MWGWMNRKWLEETLILIGMPTEWVPFQIDQKGIYIVDVRQDTVVSYVPERSTKCTKAIVEAVPSTMGNYGISLHGYEEILEQELEIVPLNGLTNLVIGDTLYVQVLFKGLPLCPGFI
jgi:CTP-dependent riboflavin kinase